MRCKIPDETWKDYSGRRSPDSVFMLAKMASHAFQILLRQQFGIDVLTFQQLDTQSI